MHNYCVPFLKAAIAGICARIVRVELVADFKAHPKHAMSVLFSPDGQWIASPSYDATVRL